MPEALSNKTIEKLKYDLVREGLITYDELIKAEELSVVHNISLSSAFIRLNTLQEENILNFIEAKLHIPYVKLEDYTLDKSSLKLISEKDARTYRIIPLFKIENVLTIAMADPLDLFSLNKLVKSLKFEIEPIICAESSIIEEIDRHYSELKINSGENFENQNQQLDWRNELNKQNLDSLQIQNILKSIFQQAIFENSQEIIFENSQIGLNLKFKIDGQMIDKGNVPLLLVSMFTSQLKVLSNLDPLVSELPQIGKYRFLSNLSEIIAAIYTFPTIKGERITVKLYKPPESLENLVKNKEQLFFIKSCLEKSGIIAVSGPALSGKTSLIYSILSAINPVINNIMTIESVIKYDLPEINQCELNENTGFNQDKAFKYINFQSPSVIYVEEIFSQSSIEYISTLADSNKLILTEFLVNSKKEYLTKLENPIFKEFKKQISCLIYIDENNKIDILQTTDLIKY